ncbi:MAG: TIGR03617 family F420-dependent LLM class oxidoreductase [Acidobacteriia bacterium]|nr:TIGR03617 family F420-dependent LLM class oxidoreductase [Terriglobia bacterium]
MKLDIGLRDYDLGTVAAYARQVESAGCDCLWTSETQHDPFLPLAAAAAATSKIKLGTSIAVAFPRSPMVLAYTAWDLQKASAGRFILGLGSQVRAHNQRRFSVKFEAPGPKLREVVLALRAIWDCWQNGAPLRFHGRFYQFDLMTPFFNPGPIAHPKIPVFIAGVNHFMCRTAGEVCDGLHVHPFHTPKYLREYVHPAVDEGLGSSGRLRQDFHYATAAFVILGETEQERARNAEAVRQQIAFYASTRTYEPVLAAHGWEGITPELHDKSLQGDWKGMAALITDEMLSTIAVTGTWDTIGSQLRERYAGLLDRVALYTPYDVPLDESRLSRLAQQLNE